MSKKFHGILAVGRTQEQAVNNYKLLSMGKNATVLASSDIAFVTQASVNIFNPASGEMDLEEHASALAKVQFSSEAADGVEVNHMVCAHGCGSHIVADSEDLLHYCPVCTSSLDEPSDEPADLSDEDDVDLSLPEEDEEEVSESADDDAEMEDADVPEDEESEDDEDVVADDGEEDGDVVAVASSFEEALASWSANSDFASESSEAEIGYVVCSNSECGSHIVHSAGVSVEHCPVCMSETQEPKEVPQGEVELADAPEEQEATPVTAEIEESDGVEEVAESGDDAETDTDETGENDLSLTDDDGNILTGKTEEVDATKELDAEASVDNLDVSYSTAIRGKSAWTAYYNGKPVAIATAATVGKNASIFDTPNFGRVVLATAQHAGVKAALSELGFAAIKHSVSVSKEVDRMVARQVEEQRAALQAESAEFKERFIAAMATAAVGINRSFFAGVENPLKAALWNAMSAVGISNPETLIDNAFAAHAETFNKLVLDKASEILAKPSDVQEALAKTILDVNYMRATASADSQVETRLASLGSVVEQLQPANTPAVETAAFTSKSRSVLANLSRPR